MNADKMLQAENMRYKKIERLANLLCNDNPLPLDYSAMDSLDDTFSVGKKITVEGENIIINKKTYSSSDIKSVTISTEGSLAIYDRTDKKLCDWSALNLSTKNIELFCLWARKHNIPAKTVSGNSERGFQLFFLVLVILTIIAVRIIYK